MHHLLKVILGEVMNMGINGNSKVAWLGCGLHEPAERRNEVSLAACWGGSV